MVYVGIDVAKDKHDCFIVNSDGEVLYDVFTIQNNMDGFEDLLFKIKNSSKDLRKVKVGLEATGHYSCNILGFLHNKGLSTIVINPLYTSLSRKSVSLRKTKTDKVDARTIASMIMSDVSLKPYSDTLYHNEDLKSLSRYRFDKVSGREILMSKRGDNIHKRKDGRWEGRYKIGTYENGKTKYRSVYGGSLTLSH